MLEGVKAGVHSKRRYLGQLTLRGRAYFTNTRLKGTDEKKMAKEELAAQRARASERAAAAAQSIRTDIDPDRRRLRRATMDGGWTQDEIGQQRREIEDAVRIAEDTIDLTELPEEQPRSRKRDRVSLGRSYRLDATRMQPRPPPRPPVPGRPPQARTPMGFVRKGSGRRAMWLP